jgi:hypothetical protein
VSLKILLDPILTARDPAHCSTYWQFYTFVNTILEQRQDVFFYWPIPDWVDPEEAKWLPDHPNITYFVVKQHRDRMNGYVHVNDDMKDAVAFYGDYWDFDVLLTVRTGMVPMYKMNMISPRQANFAWTKEVWVIEEMPLMSFKKTVAMVNPQVQDPMCLLGYLSSDQTFIISYHEKREILQIAREWFPPSKVKEIDSRIRNVVPAQKENYDLKNPDAYFDPNKTQQFCVAYVGRMMKAQSNLDKVYEAMTNTWIIRGEKSVKLLVLTVSTGGQAAWPPDHIEVQQAPREEFWRICREEMHLMIVMHEDSGFSLSLIEPMMMGVPTLCLPAPWAVALLGKDYPFYVKNEDEAYAMMKMFYEDYETMYARYIDYFHNSFVPLFKKRFAEDLLYDLLVKRVTNFETGMLDKYRKATEGRKSNQIVEAILKHVEGKEEFNLFEAMLELAESGVLKSLQRKLADGDRDKRGIVWSTPWNDMRLLMKAHHGWEDTSGVGTLKRSKA